MADRLEALERVQRLLAAAARLADGSRPEGRALRRRLLETTGLSKAGIERGLSSCLETRADASELQALLRAAPPSPAAHVLLSGNVFVAALRAIALAAASSEQVWVRPSRRDPALAEALHALEPGAFERVSELAPRPGERVWVYGSDETLDSVRQRLPRQVWLHGHGHGLGAVVVEASAHLDPALAESIALDTVLFDQRGCLSPRVVCVVGGPATARELAGELAAGLARLEQELPPGPKSPGQLAEARRQKDTAAYAFEVLDAGSGWVSWGERLVLPPAERCLHVIATTDPVAALTPIAAHLTSIAAAAGQDLREELARAFVGTRLTVPGLMQRPPLDGPVDRRAAPEITRD